MFVILSKSYTENRLVIKFIASRDTTFTVRVLRIDASIHGVFDFHPKK